MSLDCLGERPAANCLNQGTAPPLCTVITVNLSSLILLLDLQEIGWDRGARTGLIWLRIGTSGGLCKHGNEPLGFIKCRKFLD
jgi:hypothetical protein